MLFRFARHTTNLDRIEKFYTEIIGLSKLGSFENHDTYNGLFLGHHNLDWHLEFTTSLEKPNNKFDQDDILVFYINSEIELNHFKNRVIQKKIMLENPKNPYWAKNGIMISDPDGYKVIVALKDLNFISNDSLTTLVKKNEIKNWSELINFTKMLPYGRNKNREDFSLVLKEMRGTCSSKHSLLKKIADFNHFKNVNLILGIYKMNGLNTPKIARVLLENNVSYIPEAHCYLKLNNQRFDITSTYSNIEYLKDDILEEIEIQPEQVIVFKIDFHKAYIKKWITENEITINFEEIWNIREQCIKMLEQ